jgi:hypothetical protein
VDRILLNLLLAAVRCIAALSRIRKGYGAVNHINMLLALLTVALITEIFFQTDQIRNCPRNVHLLYLITNNTIKYINNNNVLIEDKIL